MESDPKRRKIELAEQILRRRIDLPVELLVPLCESLNSQDLARFIQSHRYARDVCGPVLRRRKDSLIDCIVQGLRKDLWAYDVGYFAILDIVELGAQEYGEWMKQYFETLKAVDDRVSTIFANSYHWYEQNFDRLEVRHKRFRTFAAGLAVDDREWYILASFERLVNEFIGLQTFEEKLQFLLNLYRDPRALTTAFAQKAVQAAFNFLIESFDSFLRDRLFTLSRENVERIFEKILIKSARECDPNNFFEFKELPTTPPVAYLF